MSRITEQMKACNEYFDKLAELLKDDYVIVYPFNNPKKIMSDRYLVPKGTEDKITYYGKPAASFRVSCHWNWRAAIDICVKEHYIQCLNVDLPFAKKREEEGKASKPIYAQQVAFLDEDGKYHAVYGEIYDRKLREWLWMDLPAEQAVEKAMELLKK